ncbi:conserved hypothetical protein [Kribbella flavida DSM 17836]|uniref:DUF2332 domain-containing protein n=1 Tax=Kribbella flavida (strain DSM 17836 / JCM 10339 / NBRC 14399) TaxID=479435 RepID=D2Q0J5_KRIFD|nr:DUF2332 domain-containing protein [Kribbella flavida]ADB33795.1 conserved hypothetical protein [Kribbella flavida DSM 17836]
MDVVEAFKLQAAACEELGSPLYADLLRRLVDDYELGGVSTEVLAGHEQDPGPSALALRLLGSVHRLVLAREVPELGVFYPSVGGEWDPVLGWEAFEQVLQARGPELRSLLSQPPQTNEVGRSTALYGGLLRLAEVVPLPVRLFEIGSSGGLNLRADHFRYDLADGTSFGAADSPVVFADAWSGRPIQPAPALRIAERVGSDINPVNPLSEDGALTLMSYVWPDMTERLARLRGALAVARDVPADVRREDALSFLRNLELAEGHVTVVWHSVMWQYLTQADQAAADAAIAELGERATATAPLARLCLEPMRRTPDAPYEFLIVLQVWPTGVPRILGHAAPHGVPAVWE